VRSSKAEKKRARKEAAKAKKKAAKVAAREARRAAVEAAALARAAAAEARAAGVQPAPIPEVPGPRKRKPVLSTAESRGNVVIDFDFEAVATTQEIKLMANQMKAMYAANRRAAAPFHLTYASVTGVVSSEASVRLEIQNWKGITHTSKHFLELFPTKDMVYLTPDTDNVLTEVTDDKVYIVGGLVDRNRLKGFTAKRAAELGLPMARLPIQENITLASKVLTTLHVVQILHHVHAHPGDWKGAFEAVIPARKRKQSEVMLKAGPKKSKKADEDEDEEEEGEEGEEGEGVLGEEEGEEEK
jgi:tRNA (guanine9-N1)-methyltransferase